MALERKSRRGARLPALLLAMGALLSVAGLSSCGGGGSEVEPLDPTLSREAALGKKIFHDVSLSASGRQSCASCHSPEHAHAPPNALAVQPGGARLELVGTRQAPSLRYLASNTPFGFDEEGAPSGGFFWDGRADTLAAQALGPFLNPREMANTDAAAVVARLAAAPYAGQFREVFGADILRDPARAFERMGFALQQYQLEDREFRPFDSKYDAYLGGRAQLSAAEARGLQLFNAPDKGNCAACHPSEPVDGKPPLFTDFSYDNLGVPRNRALPDNADPAHHDLGLCDRADLAAHPDREALCGLFRVPSLRNVASRKAFFHNGRFASLQEVLRFYVQRDTHPEKWYALRPDGTVDKYDDLPAHLRGSVNRDEAPYDRQPGEAPALSDEEIEDVIAFLRTLDDGWRP